jgi:hypothetical protein
MPGVSVVSSVLVVSVMSHILFVDFTTAIARAVRGMIGSLFHRVVLVFMLLVRGLRVFLMGCGLVSVMRMLDGVPVAFG